MSYNSCSFCNALDNFIDLNAEISSYPQQFSGLIAIHASIDQLKKCRACNAYFWMSSLVPGRANDFIDSFLLHKVTRIKNYEAYSLLKELLEEKKLLVTNYLKDKTQPEHTKQEYEDLKSAVSREIETMFGSPEVQIPDLIKAFAAICKDYEDHLNMLNRIFPGDFQSNHYMARSEKQKSMARAMLIMDYLEQCVQKMKDHNLPKTSLTGDELQDLAKCLDDTFKNRVRAVAALL